MGPTHTPVNKYRPRGLKPFCHQYRLYRHWGGQETIYIPRKYIYIYTYIYTRLYIVYIYIYTIYRLVIWLAHVHTYIDNDKHQSYTRMGTYKVLYGSIYLILFLTRQNEPISDDKTKIRAHRFSISLALFPSADDFTIDCTLFHGIRKLLRTHVQNDISTLWMSN